MRTGRSVRRKRFEQDACPHIEALWRTALWLTLRQSRAESLVVETMGQAYRLWPVSDDAIGCKARLFRILTRQCFGPGKDMLFTSRPSVHQHPSSSSDDRGHRLSSPDTSIDRSDSLSLSGISGISLKGAIARLRPQSRLIMLLLFRERFSYAQIAYVTGLRETTITAILGRLRRLIPRYLARHTEFSAGGNDGVELKQNPVDGGNTSEPVPEPPETKSQPRKEHKAVQD